MSEAAKAPHGLEELIALKKAKIAELRGRGVDPYPARAVRRHDCAEVPRLGAALADPTARSAEKVALAQPDLVRGL